METKQTGWVIIIAMMLAAAALIVVAFVAEIPENERWIIVVMIPAMMIPALLFYQLTVRTDRTEVRIIFGIGLIRKKWEISGIERASVVRNNVLQGWGIHFTGRTTVYNVSGFDAVELTFRNNNRKVRIGTNEPQKLADHINKLVSGRKENR